MPKGILVFEIITFLSEFGLCFSLLLSKVQNQEGFVVYTRNHPKVGEKLFLMQREVVVTKVHSTFQLIGIRYVDDVHEFFVDANAVTARPDYTCSISIFSRG